MVKRSCNTKASFAAHLGAGYCPTSTGPGGFQVREDVWEASTPSILHHQLLRTPMCQKTVLTLMLAPRQAIVILQAVSVRWACCSECLPAVVRTIYGMENTRLPLCHIRFAGASYEGEIILGRTMAGTEHVFQRDNWNDLSTSSSYRNSERSIRVWWNFVTHFGIDIFPIRICRSRRQKFKEQEPKHDNDARHEKTENHDEVSEEGPTQGREHAAWGHKTGKWETLYLAEIH